MIFVVAWKRAAINLPNGGKKLPEFSCLKNDTPIPAAPAVWRR